MNRALVTLLGLNFRAFGRRTVRGMKTWRGAFLLLFTLGFFALTIGPQVFITIMMRGRPEAHQISAVGQPIASLALLGFALMFVFTSAGEAAIAFTPAEVDLLFAAPFTRRELLFYKLAKMAMGLVFVSAFMSLMMMVNFRWWLAGFVGIMLALAMVQLGGMVMALAGQIVGEAAYTRARKMVLIALGVVAMMGLAQGMGQVQGRGMQGLLELSRESLAFRVILAPFDVFTRTMYADRWFPGLLGWGAGALAIDAALLAIVLRLDANYLETAATVSQKIYERLRRAKQGGGVAMPMGPKAGRLKVGEFPWLGGAGPIAWRQVLIVLRTSRHLLVMSVVVVAMMSAGFFFAPTPVPAAGHAMAAIAPWFGVGMTFYMTFIFSMQLPWAFRGDLDHIEFLKTLPVAPVRLAMGEVAGGIAVLTAVQLVIFGLLTAVAPSSWALMLAAAAFTLPFNGMALGLNNFLFLLYPVRHPAGSTFDFQMFGRMMLFVFLQILALVPLAGFAAALGGVAYFLAGSSWTWFVATAWVVLMAELVPILLAVAWAFLRFDVSTQTPA